MKCNICGKALTPNSDIQVHGDGVAHTLCVCNAKEKADFSRLEAEFPCLARDVDGDRLSSIAGRKFVAMLRKHTSSGKVIIGCILDGGLYPYGTTEGYDHTLPNHAEFMERASNSDEVDVIFFRNNKIIDPKFKKTVSVEL